LSQSESLLFSLKHRVAVSSLRSFSFDKVTRQQLLEQSYQLAWEVRGWLRDGHSSACASFGSLHDALVLNLALAHSSAVLN
jgi:hypothetical protein